MDISQRVLFKKSYNGYFFNSLPGGIWVIATSFAGIFALSAAASGWLLKKTSVPERILLITGALTLIHPAYWTDAVGLALDQMLFKCLHPVCNPPDLIHVMGYQQNCAALF